MKPNAANRFQRKHVGVDDDPCTTLCLKILMTVKGCIEERATEDTVEDGGSSNNHLLDDVHTHIGIGVFIAEGQLRYVEVSYSRFPVITTRAGAVDIRSGFA